MQPDTCLFHSISTNLSHFLFHLLPSTQSALIHPPAYCPSNQMPPLAAIPSPHQFQSMPPHIPLPITLLGRVAAKHLSSYIKSVSILRFCDPLRSSTSGQLLIWCVCTKRFGNSSFGFSAPIAWNSLP